MIKTRGIPSTGLDLFPTIKYHFGSHYVIGCLSKLLNVGVLEFFNFGYLIVFLPLLVRTMLSFVVIFQSEFLELKTINLNFPFWFLFFAPFVGFISFDGNSTALNTGIGYQTIIYSESYGTSFIYTFALFSAIAVFAKRYPKRLFTDYQVWNIIFIVFPTLAFLAGLTKISTLLLLISSICYLFLRLQLYKKWYFNCALLIIMLSFVICFYLTNDPHDEEGGFYLFQFLEEIIKVPWYVFALVHYSLTIFLAWFFYLEKISTLLRILKVHLWRERPWFWKCC